MESDRLRFDSSWELRMFSLSHTRDEMIKTSFSTFEVLSKLAFRTALVCTSKTFLLIKLFYFFFIFFLISKLKDLRILSVKPHYLVIQLGIEILKLNSNFPENPTVHRMSNLLELLSLIDSI